MAGMGGRFRAAGIEVPKPLIEVRGRPMVWWAVEGLPRVPPESLVFIVREEHIRNFAIDARLRALFSPHIRVIAQERSPAGQAVSVLAAEHDIAGEEPLLIHNCDTHVPGVGRDLNAVLREHPEADGWIPIFGSCDPELSYVETDSSGLAIRVAEKEVISDRATIGTYYFARGDDFVWAAHRMISEGRKVRGEFYVLPCYQYLIARGMKIRTFKIDPVYILGTPEGVTEFELLSPTPEVP
jgi:NDP-sugar pyrophosphorylase family protein